MLTPNPLRPLDRLAAAIAALPLCPGERTIQDQQRERYYRRILAQIAELHRVCDAQPMVPRAVVREAANEIGAMVQMLVEVRP